MAEIEHCGLPIADCGLLEWRLTDCELADCGLGDCGLGECGLAPIHTPSIINQPIGNPSIINEAIHNPQSPILNVLFA
jgi:hypothetical protein